MPSHSTHTHNSQETDKFQKMAKAAQDWIGTHDTPPFPDFLDPKIKALVVSDSHLVRGGLEYLGDRVLYPMVGAALMKTIPNRPHLFASMLSALTCNATLGEYMVAHRMHARTANKGGGDTFETVFGALVKDRKRLGYSELQAFIHQFVGPVILECVAAVECGKRKHEDDGVDLRSVAPISDLPRAKRQRPDAREEEMPRQVVRSQCPSANILHPSSESILRSAHIRLFLFPALRAHELPRTFSISSLDCEPPSCARHESHTSSSLYSTNRI
ncbi:hypothetical protein DFH06DRAFT_1215599 [Mycena polygramma]|nr:hypothetical protein DFH06DRAFT_1215599 [Mycena polygramma]